MEPSEFRDRQATLGLTNRELGLRLDRHYVTISRWRSGAEPIPPWVLLAFRAISNGKKWPLLERQPRSRKRRPGPRLGKVKGKR